MLFRQNDRFEERFLVSETIYNGFIATFNDRNPLHVDDAYALLKGFKKKVVHGNILNGFVSYFVGECLPVKNVILHSQDIRYDNPVYVNDELLFEAIVTGVHESVNAVVFKFKFVRNGTRRVAGGNFQIGVLS
jgi:3-hydroxybutyryl-CoA dehydratase